MSDRQPKRKRANPEEIADLFRILRNMCRDEEVSDAHFRLAFRIAQGRNDDTGWAEASHDLLIDEVPRTQKGKLRKFRDVMATKLGWFRTMPGQRGQGTMYYLQDARCAALEAESERKREARHAKSALNRIERITALKAAGLGVNPDPLSEDHTSELRGEILPPNGPSSGVNPLPVAGQISTPVLPHSTTSTEGYRKQDLTQDAQALLPACASVPARAYPPVISEFDSAALRAELLVRELPRSQSGAFMCIDCGNETQLAARYKSEPFYPHCPDCIEASAFPDVKPIAGQPSYAEASRGE